MKETKHQNSKMHVKNTRSFFQAEVNNLHKPSSFIPIISTLKPVILSPFLYHFLR